MVLPKEARERLGLKPGDMVMITIKDGILDVSFGRVGEAQRNPPLAVLPFWGGGFCFTPPTLRLDSRSEGWAKGMGSAEAAIGVFMMALFLVTFTRKAAQ